MADGFFGKVKMLIGVEEEEPEEWEDDLSPGRNPAVDFGRMAYADEELEDSAVLGRQRRTRASRRKKAAEAAEKKPRKKKRPIGGQILLALGEIILIIWIVRWWLQWIS